MLKETKSLRTLSMLTLSVLAALSVPVYAAEEPVETRKVVIPATRTEQEIKDAPASVDIITREEIDNVGASTLIEALKMRTSIFVSPAMNSSSVSIRGMSGRHVLILVDGQRLTSEGSSATMNGYEWDRINMANVERIEIVRGASSSVYGSDALGGVINVITKKSTQESFSLNWSPARMSDKWGTGSDNISFYYSPGQKGSSVWSIAGGQNDTDPKSKPNDSTTSYYGTRKFINLAGSHNLHDNTYLDVKVDVLEEDMKQMGAMSRLSYYENRRHAYSIGLRGEHSKGDYMIRTYYGEQDKTQDTLSANTLTRGEDAKRKNWVIEGNTSLQLDSQNLLTIGGEFRQETYSSLRNNISKTKFEYTALYLQDEYSVNDRLLLIPSMRYDDSSKFGSNVSPSLGVTYKMSENRRIKFNAGKGFKAPSIDDMYIHMPMGAMTGSPNFVIGNPDLKPEKSTNYEISIEGEKGNSFGSLTYFKNDVKNKIINQPLPSGDYQYRNVDYADIDGFEVEWGRHLTDKWLVKANYTYLDATGQTTGMFGKTVGRLTGSAKQSGTVQIHYDDVKDSGVSVILWNAWVKDYLHTANNSKTYNTWNVSVNKKWSDKYETYFGVDNIFNKKDYDILLWGSTIKAGVTVKL